MNNSAQHPKPPSLEQIDYLKDLAEQTGCTFTWPASSSDAGEQITQLKSLKKSRAADRRRERRQIQDDMAHCGGAARVHDHELCGYGSTAHWS